MALGGHHGSGQTTGLVGGDRTRPSLTNTQESNTTCLASGTNIGGQLCNKQHGKKSKKPKRTVQSFLSCPTRTRNEVREGRCGSLLLKSCPR